MIRPEITEVSRKNLSDCIGLDIVAFHWAAAGACGEPGSVIFLTREGQIYHANYVFSDISEADLVTIFPPFTQMIPGIFGGGTYPHPWKDQYLGLGNFLVVHESIWEDFHRIAEEELARKKSEGEYVILFQIWIDVVLKTLGFNSL